MQGNLFTLAGLTLNTLGSSLLIFPLLNTKKHIEDDRIKFSNPKAGEFTQNKHLKERKIGLWGFGLLMLGFILQLVPIIFSIQNK